MTAEDEPRAVAEGGPLDGRVLGPAGAERYEVRMADGSRHLYLRAERAVAQGVCFTYAGRR